MKYHDMIIEASEAKRLLTPEKSWQGQFKLRAFQSPAGGMKPEEAVEVIYDVTALRDSLQALELRSLDREGLIALGRQLAKLLLPLTTKQKEERTSLRELFDGSLAKISRDDRLRIRLRLPPELAELPWEYVYVDRAGGGEGMDGFLALDPRVAIIRDEALLIPADSTLAKGNIKIVVALSSNIDMPPLNLAKEKSSLEQVLAGQVGLQPTFLQKATLDEVQAAITDARVFHFAGHGVFAREMGKQPGTYIGTGGIALEDEFVAAEQLGINLRHQGIRLAVLGGCETGRRGGAYVWSGVAPALVKAEIPAVVANQYSILDKTAIAFSRQFYQALVGGMTIEAAVSAGRIAAYNADNEGRDWGVPVLYLRAADGQLFEGAENGDVRVAARRAVESMVQQYADQHVQIGNIQAPTSIVSAPTSIGSMAPGAIVFGPMIATAGGEGTQQTRQSTLPGDRGTVDQLADPVSADKISTERTPPGPATPIPTQTQSAQASMEAISEALRPVLLKLVAELQGDNIRLALLDVFNLSYEVARGSDADTGLISNHVKNLIQLAPTVEPELRNLFSNKQFAVLLTSASFASSPPLREEVTDATSPRS